MTSQAIAEAHVGKMLVALGVLWLILGAVGASLADRHREVTIADIGLGAITLGNELRG